MCPQYSRYNHYGLRCQDRFSSNMRPRESVMGGRSPSVIRRSVKTAALRFSTPMTVSFTHTSTIRCRRSQISSTNKSSLQTHGKTIKAGFTGRQSSTSKRNKALKRKSTKSSSTGYRQGDTMACLLFRSIWCKKRPAKLLQWLVLLNLFIRKQSYLQTATVSSSINTT